MNLFRRRKPEVVVSVPTTTVQPNGRYKPKGRESCKKSILSIWSKIPVIFSSRHVARETRDHADVMFMDTTVTRSMRMLREEGKINFIALDRSIGSYKKL